jgi:hypothetical protein
MGGEKSCATVSNTIGYSKLIVQDDILSLAQKKHARVRVSLQLLVAAFFLLDHGQRMMVRIDSL